MSSSPSCTRATRTWAGERVGGWEGEGLQAWGALRGRTGRFSVPSRRGQSTQLCLSVSAHLAILLCLPTSGSAVTSDSFHGSPESELASELA